jgi:hypothetical protein
MVAAGFIIPFRYSSSKNNKYFYSSGGKCGKCDLNLACICKIFLAFLSDLQTLASHWLDEFAKFTLAYLIIDQSYAASD